MSKGYEQDSTLCFGKECVVRQYYLHTRNRIFYVQFTDPATQKRLPAISTGKSNRDDAVMVVALWLKDGIPQRKAKQEDESHRSLDALINVNHLFQALKQLELTTQDVLKIEKILKDRGLVETIIRKDSKEAELVTDYLRRFWDYNQSPYIADKRSHGIKLGKTYANLCVKRVEIYWVPYKQKKK
jgi:hypothetical protein